MTMLNVEIHSAELGHYSQSVQIPVGIQSTLHMVFDQKDAAVISLETDYYNQATVELLLDAMASSSAGTHTSAGDFDIWMKDFLAD